MPQLVLIALFCYLFECMKSKIVLFWWHFRLTNVEETPKHVKRHRHIQSDVILINDPLKHKLNATAEMQTQCFISVDNTEKQQTNI